MPNTGSGRLGEQLTAEYLEEKGYEIVERNFKWPLRRDRYHRAE